MQRLFEGRSTLEARFGRELARLICCHISYLEASERLSAVPTCRPMECRCDGGTLYSVALDDEHRLAFEALHEAGTDPADIHSIRLLGVATP